MNNTPQNKHSILTARVHRQWMEAVRPERACQLCRHGTREGTCASPHALGMTFQDARARTGPCGPEALRLELRERDPLQRTLF